MGIDILTRPNMVDASTLTEVTGPLDSMSYWGESDLLGKFGVFCMVVGAIGLVSALTLEAVAERANRTGDPLKPITCTEYAFTAPRLAYKRLSDYFEGRGPYSGFHPQYHIPENSLWMKCLLDPGSHQTLVVNLGVLWLCVAWSAMSAISIMETDNYFMRERKKREWRIAERELTYEERELLEEQYEVGLTYKVDKWERLTLEEKVEYKARLAMMNSKTRRDFISRHWKVRSKWYHQNFTEDVYVRLRRHHQNIKDKELRVVNLERYENDKEYNRWREGLINERRLAVLNVQRKEHSNTKP